MLAWRLTSLTFRLGNEVYDIYSVRIRHRTLHVWNQMLTGAEKSVFQTKQSKFINYRETKGNI